MSRRPHYRNAIQLFIWNFFRRINHVLYMEVRVNQDTVRNLQLLTDIKECFEVLATFCFGSIVEKNYRNYGLKRRLFDQARVIFTEARH